MTGSLFSLVHYRPQFCGMRKLSATDGARSRPNIFVITQKYRLQPTLDGIMHDVRLWLTFKRKPRAKSAFFHFCYFHNISFAQRDYKNFKEAT
jgi:hypothetical protein